jgi:hypothetical protein
MCYDKGNCKKKAACKPCFSLAALAAFLGVIVCSVPLPVIAQNSARPAPKPAAPFVLTFLTTDEPIRGRKIVPALTSGNDFAEIMIPAAAPIVRNGKRVPLTAIRPGLRLVCRGDWTDATRSTFRTVLVTIEGTVPPRIVQERVALACQKLSGRSRPSRAQSTLTASSNTASAASTRFTASRIGAAEAFVLDSGTVEREENAVPKPGTENYPYHVHGILRNISGLAYDAVEVQISVLDRDGKKVADQTAAIKNVRPGDRWQFRAEPPVYMPYRLGHTVRIERITAVPRRE